MNEEVNIKKAVLHILDTNISIPALSNNELEIDSEISTFLQNHIEKILNDNNLKNARFIGDDNKICRLSSVLREDTNRFVEVTIEIATALFDIMLKNIDISPADLICCLFTINNVLHLGILKLNYKQGFTHYVQQVDGRNSNTIIKHQSLLPSDSQKIDECILINLNDYSIKLIEKEYEINGEKDFYLSKIFLVCDSDLSNNAKLKILDKVTQKINKKYYDEDFEKVAKLKKAVSETLEENSSIEVNTLAQQVFDRNFEIQNEYVAEVKKAGLTEEKIDIPQELAAKKYKSHKIKTDTGIEINFPLECFDDREKIEFLNNPDGTISIIIKNVTRITNR